MRFFKHIAKLGSDGAPVRCRASGQCKVWKTRPADFKLPVKWGLYVSFYITPENAHEWEPEGTQHDTSDSVGNWQSDEDLGDEMHHGHPSNYGDQD